MDHGSTSMIPLIEGNKTSNGEIDYITFYSLQDIKEIDHRNFQPIWLQCSIAFPRWWWPSDWLRIQYDSTISQSEGCFHVGKAIDQSEEGLCLQLTPPPPPGAERSYLHY